MKLLVWCVFAVLTLLWTLTAWIVARLAGAAAAAVREQGGMPSSTETPWSWQIPPELASWIDPAVLLYLQQMMSWSLEGLRDTLPFFGGLLGWIVPLTWMGWAMGLVLMLAGAAVAHWLAGRAAAPAQG
jgi:hypothetical protein